MYWRNRWWPTLGCSTKMPFWLSKWCHSLFSPLSYILSGRSTSTTWGHPCTPWPPLRPCPSHQSCMCWLFMWSSGLREMAGHWARRENVLGRLYITPGEECWKAREKLKLRRVSGMWRPPLTLFWDSTPPTPENDNTTMNFTWINLMKLLSWNKIHKRCQS